MPTAPQITPEQQAAERLGATIAAWDKNSIIIKYTQEAQRQQLIDIFKTLGWQHPINDPDDAAAMVLDIRRAAFRATSNTVMESAAIGIYFLVAVCCVLVCIGAFDVVQTIHKHAILRAIVSGLTYLVITAVIFFCGAPYTSLRVQLGVQEIRLNSLVQTLTIRVSEVKSCGIQTFFTFGMPFMTIIFIMKNGVLLKVPAPYKGFTRLAEEMRRRYPFLVRTS